MKSSRSAPVNGFPGTAAVSWRAPGFFCESPRGSKVKIKVREPLMSVYIYIYVYTYILIPSPSSGNVHHSREVPCEYLYIYICCKNIYNQNWFSFIQYLQLICINSRKFDEFCFDFYKGISFFQERVHGWMCLMFPFQYTLYQELKWHLFWLEKVFFWSLADQK